MRKPTLPRTLAEIADGSLDRTVLNFRTEVALCGLWCFVFLIGAALVQDFRSDASGVIISASALCLVYVILYCANILLMRHYDIQDGISISCALVAVIKCLPGIGLIVIACSLAFTFIVVGSLQFVVIPVFGSLGQSQNLWCIYGISAIFIVVMALLARSVAVILLYLHVVKRLRLIVALRAAFVLPVSSKCVVTTLLKSSALLLPMLASYCFAINSAEFILTARHADPALSSKVDELIVIISTCVLLTIGSTFDAMLVGDVVDRGLI